MKQDEAIDVVTVLAAAFRTDVTDDTAIMWARQLLVHDLRDAKEAIDLLATTQAFMPPLKLVLDCIEDCRRIRRANELVALPSYGGDDCCRGQWFGHAYRDHFTDEERAQADALIIEAKTTPPRDQRVVLEAFLKLVGS